MLYRSGETARLFNFIRLNKDKTILAVMQKVASAIPTFLRFVSRDLCQACQQWVVAVLQAISFTNLPYYSSEAPCTGIVKIII